MRYYLVSKKLGIEKSIGVGIGKIWYWKKFRIRFRSDFGYRHTLPSYSCRPSYSSTAAQVAATNALQQLHIALHTYSSNKETINYNNTSQSAPMCLGCAFPFLAPIGTPLVIHRPHFDFLLCPTPRCHKSHSELIQ